MVGIVGILLLGSLAWSAVGALASAVGAASSALSSAANPPPPPTLAPVSAVTPEPAASATLEAPTPTAQPPTVLPTATVPPTAAPPTATTQPQSTPTSPPAATPTAQVAGRNPWILLPQPEPGANVPPGSVTVEARGRGDAPITTMRIEVDGAALPTSVEQRSEVIWRGSATARVTPGQHNVRAVVTDADGRSGSYRWTFTAAPAP